MLVEGSRRRLPWWPASIQGRREIESEGGGEKKNESKGRGVRRRVLRKGGGRRGREYYGSAPEVSFLFNLAPLQTL